MHPSCNDGAIESDDRATSRPARPRLPHARRMGTARSHVARLASRKTDSPGKFEPIPWVYADIVRNLARVERVRILVRDATMKRQVREILKKSDVNLSAVDFYLVPTDRGWIRDFGPIFIKDADGDSAITNWQFNGWAKFENWRRDDAATSKLFPRLKCAAWEPMHRERRVVLEGGSIDVNGHGAMLTTEECLLSKYRSAIRDSDAKTMGTLSRLLWGYKRALDQSRNHRR